MSAPEEPGEGVEPATGSVLAAVEQTLEALDLEDEDVGAATLARRLAVALDVETSGRTVAELSGRLLAVLDALGATPAARKSIVPKGGAHDGAAESPKKAKLRALRDEHDGRTG
ncbi:hypothetical protein [Amycolatopsis sp. NPDC051128]|uniref:terminase small subunit n=1 Tax=Amycolatopsis sp. NPDC051128 TaxID=3155412 RepID=UPI00343C54B3